MSSSVEGSIHMNSETGTRKRALIIRAGQLGDTVWATTVIEPIRAFLGEQTLIDIIVKRGMGKLFEYDRRIETIFEIDHRNIPLPFSPTKLSVLRKSLQHPYDLAINLETGPQFTSLMRHVRATRKIYESTLPPLDNGAEGRNMVHLTGRVLAQGIPAHFCRDAAPSLQSPEHIDVAALIGNNRDYLCLHPGNSYLARGKPALRSWPESCWQELIGQITRHFPALQIVLIGEKSERALSEAVAASFPCVINLAGRTSLQQLMAVLAHSRALVTTDTGPAHVAAALATPVIAVFGPSEAHGTGPFAGRNGWAVSVMKNIGCNPCVNTERAKTCSDNRCMQAVTPSDVVKILDAALLKRPLAPVIELDDSSK
jgi:ADP-heptose:LPS heptosyltransferase